MWPLTWTILARWPFLPCLIPVTSPTSNGLQRPLLAQARAPERPQGAPVEKEPFGAQRHPLDPEDRSPMGGPTRPLSVVSNVSPAISVLGALRPAAKRPRNSGAGAPRRRLSGSARSVHGRELRARSARRRGRGQDQTRQGFEDPEADGHDHRRLLTPLNLWRTLRNGPPT